MSSWFISPWDTVRFSLEAQRLIALQFFPYAPLKEQTHQEERDRKAVVPVSAPPPIYRLRRDRGKLYGRGQWRPAAPRTLLGRQLQLGS
jgi:hypothetical protein